jgi:DNA/RNA-binding domain of Phe-tRNA-synthetase-like protein
MPIRIELPAVRLGIVEADEVSVHPGTAELARLMDQVCERVRREHTVESLPDAEPVRAVRAMFRAWGVDPSKYRPSSEALLRRVLQGKGLYRVLNAVDVGNLCSVETGWPYGCYDRGRIGKQAGADIVLRSGAADERYEGIGKRVWHLGGRPVLADAAGPFGSPISDSTRSMITESAHDVLAVIYAPPSAPEAAVERAAARLGERLAEFAGAKSTRFRVDS